MERPIDQIRQAEQSMQELQKAAKELRQQIELACAHNPGETAELTRAAAAFEKEIERIQDYLQQWKRGIQ
jgi:predicted  nucleic acid-binding Zn-ribbon protein